MTETDNASYSAQFARWSSAELLAASNFAAMDYRIAWPMTPCRYDFIVDSGFLYRVQVKVLSWRTPRQRRLGKGDRACWSASLQMNRGGSKTRTVYAMTDFDIFVAVCDASRIYVLPVEVLRCPTRPERLIRSLRIKLPGTRADSKRWAARWEPYLNQFALPRPETS